MTTVPLGDPAADAMADALRDPDRCPRTLTELSAAPPPGWTWEGAPMAFEQAVALGGEMTNRILIVDAEHVVKVRRDPRGRDQDADVRLALARSGCRQVVPPVGQGAWGEHVIVTVNPRIHGEDAWRLALAGEVDLADIAALGAATGGLHAAMQRVFPLRTTRPEVLVDTLEARVRQHAGAAPEVAARMARITALMDAARASATPAPIHHIHGDLHLGQWLRTAGGEWFALDFEGEPGRTPDPDADSPLEDVASMLRSLAYAREHARLLGDAHVPEAAAAHEAYCAAYEAAAGSPLDRPLLRACEAARAAHEVAYETAHRQRFLPIAIAVLDEVLDEGPDPGPDQSAATPATDKVEP
jgi:maltokinase